MKNGCLIEVKLSEDLLRKLIYISEAEGRNPSSQFTFMLRNNISYFERTKGRISPDALKKVDISAYCEDKDEE
jgi:hypothetical protein